MVDAVRAYLEKVSNYDAAQLHEYQRGDYTEDSQLYAEYVDYVEEWKYDFERKLHQIRRDFIYQMLSLRRQTIQCGDHTHAFTPVEDSEAIHFPRPDAYIDPNACWYKTILTAEEFIVRQPHSPAVATLSVTEQEFLKRMTRLGLLQDSQTSTLLSFQQYRTLWWDDQTRDNAMRILNMSEPNPITNVILQARHDLPPPRAAWVTPVSEPNHQILDASVIANDHGLHALLRVRNDSKHILDVINQVRSQSKTPGYSLIEPAHVAASMKTCPSCAHIKSRGFTSPTGVYYAPPGNGKTTAMAKELFIGVDTDWLLANSSFNTIIAPFLTRDIPVLTNQLSLSLHAGERFFGSFDESRLRSDERGQSYTNWLDVLNHMIATKGDLHVYRTTDYVSTSLLGTYMLKYIYEYTRTKFAPPGTTPVFRVKPRRHKSPQDQIRELERMKPPSTARLRYPRLGPSI